MTCFVARPHPAPYNQRATKFFEGEDFERHDPLGFRETGCTSADRHGKNSSPGPPGAGKRTAGVRYYLHSTAVASGKNLTKFGVNYYVDRVGVNDNFFELGGNSLLAVRLIAQLEKISGKQFLPATIFQSPTIAQLAIILRQEKHRETLGLSDADPTKLQNRLSSGFMET